jgi:hypothetical protein
MMIFRLQRYFSFSAANSVLDENHRVFQMEQPGSDHADKENKNGRSFRQHYRFL